MAVRRDGVELDSFPFTIPALRSLEALELDPGVTVFVGENGSGKSTLIEAIAVAAGFNAEGGSMYMQFATRASHSDLDERLVLERGAHRPRTGYFLRAESFYNVATEIERLDKAPGFDPPILDACGGVSLHERSHGESFLALALNRFGPNGLYILDEPEAALSVRGCLALIARMHDLVAEGSQFVMATHSPLLMAYPGATIYVLDESGLNEARYEETEQVQLTKAFLDAPERLLRHLLAE